MMQARKIHCGFTLIEMVIGMVVMAMALTLLFSLFFSNPARSVEPMLQMRATVFAQSLMDEILGKAFDETTPVGAIPACSVCTDNSRFGSDGELRADFDDVDDYNDYCNTSNPVALIDAQGNLPTNYDNFRMSVCVSYDGDFNGNSDNDINAKLITVTLFPPTGTTLSEAITFTAYRGNF